MTDDEEVRGWSDSRLEEEMLRQNAEYPTRGAAKAELTRRQREHEMRRDSQRRDHQDALFDAESRNQVFRKQFDDRLANEARCHAEKMATEGQAFAEAMQQRAEAHAEKIATEQLKPANRLVWATALSVIAAIASAVAAVASVFFSYLTYHDQHAPTPSVIAAPAANSNPSVPD